MTEIINRYILVIALLVPSVAWAQDDDFGSWFSVGMSHDISKKLELNVESSLRTDQNSTHIKTALIESGIERELFEIFSLSANYRFSYKDDDQLNYILLHRFYSDLKIRIPIREFDLSGRVRYQREYQINIDDAKDKVPEEYLRFKLGVDYDWPSSPYNPYTSFEIYYPLHQNNSIGIEKRRVQAGIEYKMRNKKSLQLGLLFQEDQYPARSYFYGVTIAYDFSL